MKIKNLTPFLHGAKVTSRTPPRPEMTVIVRGLFHLSPDKPVEIVGTSMVDQGRMTADVFEEDDETREGEVVYPSDFADFKPRADVLLRATCHALGGKPITECPVRFAVGRWSKVLRVVGTRAWSDGGPGAVMSQVAPFRSVPIRYGHAFGGPGYAANPVGRGLGDVLPNVEYPGASVRSRGERPPPAGFGPINPAWAERSSKVGRAYGGSYRKQRAPYYAEDFDWTYFNAAPADQQLAGYLRGDEEMTFENLHPSAPRFSARLPGLRVRTFVHDRVRRFREVPMVLDTLFADLEAERLTLTYRGLVEVEDDDLADVSTVLIASEPLSADRLSEGHYRDQLLAFERDPIGLVARTPPEVRAFLEQTGPEASTKEPPVEPLITLLRAQKGGLAPEQEAEIRRALATPPVANTNEPGIAQPVVLPMPRTPGAAPAVPIADLVRMLRAEAARLKPLFVENPITKQAIESLEALASDPRLAALDPTLSADGRPNEDPGPGRNLAGRDLRGSDLSDRDLTGADFTGANLAGAKLARAKLSGATLKQAILHEADLSGADLSGADLTQANLTNATLAGADLGRALLQQTFFRKADLSRATLDEARIDQAVFQSTDLSGATARSARMSRLHFEGARLEGAVLAKAEMVRCRVLKSDAKRIDLSGAVLHGSSFSDTDLTGALLRGATGERTTWLRATLRGADLRGSVLPRAVLDDAVADGARLAGADLRGARFYRASLASAELSHANLFGADMRKARLVQATLRGASLYDAKLVGADLTRCDLSGASLARSTLENA